MSGAPPIPQNEIRRPVSRVIDVQALVYRLDPNFHRPDPEYVFSNGRVFSHIEGLYSQ